MNQINPVQRTAEIARRLVALGEREKALHAYALLIHQLQGQDPQLELEGAVYILQNEGDYKIAYDSFRRLYNQGYFREDLFSLMMQAFYLPNMKAQKSRYDKNCKLLSKYPYLFRKDFPKFEELPLLFFPYDDHGYITYDPKEDQFGPYIDYSHEVVSRNFFKDLEKPILAADVFSQYELEYLNDNVRKSEWVARENHIYLHYADWAVFCAHLQVLNLKELLKDKKFIFLFDEEIEQYPIDFKARFGIDYSQYNVVPIGSREIHRLIWHTQLAAHNGGDFFNEIFDNHPNLISLPSLMLENVQETMDTLRTALRNNTALNMTFTFNGTTVSLNHVIDQLRPLPQVTDHDLFMTFMMNCAPTSQIDPAARIVPAVFFQPHFSNIIYSLTPYANNVVTLHSEQYEDIRNSPIFKSFKYIKTFTPVRRITSSCGATVRFMDNYAKYFPDKNAYTLNAVSDVLTERLLNRSHLIDWQDRLFKDSVMVRFEDGKLNPKATFTALAAFLDLPYTESMTYCSVNGVRDVPTAPGVDMGFSLAALQRTYEEYLGTPERYYLEFFMQDLYAHCGYDLQYYDGEPMDLERAESFFDHFTVQDTHIRNSLEAALHRAANTIIVERESLADTTEDEIDISDFVEKRMANIKETRRDVAKLLLESPKFVNKNAQLLRMMPMLQLDPALLEQPLYH